MDDDPEPLSPCLNFLCAQFQPDSFEALEHVVKVSDETLSLFAFKPSVRWSMCWCESDAAVSTNILEHRDS